MTEPGTPLDTLITRVVESQPPEDLWEQKAAELSQVTDHLTNRPLHAIIRD